MIKRRNDPDLVTITFQIPREVRDKATKLGELVDMSFTDFSRVVYEAGLHDVVFKKTKGEVNV